MNCNHCGNIGSKVIDSRCNDGIVRRRRECLVCADRFTTYEVDAARLGEITRESGAGTAFVSFIGALEMLLTKAKEQDTAIRLMEGAFRPGRLDIRRLQSASTPPTPREIP